MTPIGAAIIGLTVLLAAIVGAFLAIAAGGGDTGPIGTAGAAAGAFLGALVTAELVRTRRDGR